ncbi:MAG: sigma-70 family RNA polymerase sigma factor [Polyangiaceae bacterium]|nr:sigma-70 family RNA polymerase sigma factor [Polyangiaceae bacterium]
MPHALAPAYPWPLVLSGGEVLSKGTRAPIAVASIQGKPLNNDDLVSRCQAGDQAAFAELFRTHKDRVAGIIFRMTGNRSEMDDLIQEVFLQVHRSIGRFGGRSKFSTWLYRVTVNVVLMHRRSARSRPVLVEDMGIHPAEDPRALPDELSARAIRAERFYLLLDQLSEKKRTVYVLHELEGRKPNEIAEIVGAPILTVRTRLFYARKEFEKLIEADPTLSALPDEVDSSAEDSGVSDDDNSSTTAGSTDPTGSRADVA